MINPLKTTALAAAVAATTLTSVPPADAHPEAIWAAAIIGVAAGALIGGLFARNHWGPTYTTDPSYSSTQPMYAPNYSGAAPMYATSYGETGYSTAEWSPEWLNYCRNRYRTFNPRTGTFTGNDGQQHFCIAR